MRGDVVQFTVANFVSTYWLQVSCRWCHELGSGSGLLLLDPLVVLNLAVVVAL